MQIHLNGEEQQVSENTTMSELVQKLNLGEQRFAIEVNGELLPRGSFSQHQLQPGDQVEVVQAIGGG
ncbi:MAG: sulfur carrier protein ThiS [Gammaproteobacteria bacterium]|nr:sulfur carrier protein ThiS [Gammaproteobacteria bacterium]